MQTPSSGKVKNAIKRYYCRMDAINRNMFKKISQNGMYHRQAVSNRIANTRWTDSIGCKTLKNASLLENQGTRIQDLKP